MNPADFNLEKEARDLAPDCWTLEEGVKLARMVEPHAQKFGFHVALAGGVLMKGRSDKDVDLLFYVRKTLRGASPLDLLKRLEELGFRKQSFRSGYHTDDTKPVFMSFFKGRRVDLIFAS